MEWPSGEATACKAVHTGSIPVSTSEFDPARLAQRESASLTRKRSLVQSQYRPLIRKDPRAISSAGERFPDTEEVTGSIPVSRTSRSPGRLDDRGFVVSAVDPTDRGQPVKSWVALRISSYSP